MRGIQCLTIILFAGIALNFGVAVFAQTPGQYPSTQIASREVVIQMYLPDAEKGYYRGTRFDWSGLIQQVKYQGHTFFGNWKTTHNPTNYEDANGTAGEFGANSPLGYGEAKVGDVFIKIGVGKLRKASNQSYQFSYNYKIVEPFPWAIKSGDSWIEFEQRIDEFQGWGYHYVKRIELNLEKPEFTITHTLQNTGTKLIDTDHYCHNFTIIDEDPIGDHYRLQFPFAVKARQSLKGIAEVIDREIVFKKSLINNWLFSELDGVESIPEHNQVTITNVKTGARLRITGDRPPIKFNFYAADLAVCPEPFVTVKIAPGETFTWENRYALFVNSAAALPEK